MSGVIYPINDKKYTAEDVEIFNCTRTSGVYSVLDFDYSLSGSVLTLGKGLAWIKNGDFSGKAIAFKDVTTITLDGADSTGDRYDVIAVRYDATKKEPEIVVIKGNASPNPAMPTRSTESYLYELFLYAVLRKAGEAGVSSDNVIDLRGNETYCGIMRDSVTSAVAPVYETIYEGEGLVPGDVVNFDTEKFESLIATVTATYKKVSGDVVLRRGEDSLAFSAGHIAEPRKTFSGSNVFSIEANPDDGLIYLYVDLTRSGSEVTVRKCTAGVSSETASQSQYVKITKLVGVTKQPEGYVKVDSLYNPESHNAQSGEAVKQAIDKALEEFEPPEQGGGSGVSEAQRQTLMAVINAIGLFNVPNAQELLDNFNKAWDVVEPVPATNIILNKTEITFTSEEPQTLVASVLPPDTTDVVVWKSSDISIATVVGGVVTPLNDGETTITARAGNVSATCKVTVSLYGDIENPVYLLNGYLGKESTSTSEPMKNDTYSNALSLTAIPVNNGSVFTVTSTRSNSDNKNFNRWRFYDESGAYSKDLYSSDASGYTTVTASANGFIRFEMLYTASIVVGDELPVTKVTVTTNGETTEYTVVDKR